MIVGIASKSAGRYVCRPADLLATPTVKPAKRRLCFFRNLINKQLREAKIKVGTDSISFNKEATRWLGVWLDSQLKFTSHINERVRRARTAEIQIKGLTKTYGLVPSLIRRIQLSVVQSTALYGAELWWKSQKNHERTIQQMINRQARSITGMYYSTSYSPITM